MEKLNYKIKSKGHSAFQIFSTEKGVDKIVWVGTLIQGDSFSGSFPIVKTIIDDKNKKSIQNVIRVNELGKDNKSKLSNVEKGMPIYVLEQGIIRGDIMLSADASLDSAFTNNFGDAVRKIQLTSAVITTIVAVSIGAFTHFKRKDSTSWKIATGIFGAWSVYSWYKYYKPTSITVTDKLAGTTVEKKLNKE